MSSTEAEPDSAAPEESPSASEPELLHGVPVVTVRGETVAFPTREQYTELMKSLHEEGFEMCIDLCGVDYLANGTRVVPEGVALERFEVVVNLLSLTQRRRVRVRVQVPEGDPTVDSLFSLWPGTEAMEREAWDMFGIAFNGHPDLTRILMPEDWEGHPLRKDYAIGRVPVQFKATTPRPASQP